MRPQRYEHGIRRLTHMLPNHSLGTVCKLARGCSKSRSKVDPSRAPRFASRFSCSGFATGAERKPAIRSQSLALRPSQEPAIRSRLLASPPIVWKPAIRSQSLAVPPSLERCALKGLGGTREAITISTTSGNERLAERRIAHERASRLCIQCWRAKFPTW